MEKHQFDDCDIKIDHKKEELEIIVSSIPILTIDLIDYFIRLKKINEVLLHYPAVNDQYQHFVFSSHSGVLSINHFDYLMKSISTWYDPSLSLI
jgi:hypothetical protein